MKRKREKVFCLEILLTIVFFFIGFVATIFGESVHFPEIGIIAEMAVIGGVILWRMRKNNKKIRLIQRIDKGPLFFYPYTID